MSETSTTDAEAPSAPAVTADSSQQGGDFRVDAATAQLAAWGALGLLNQLLILVRLPTATASVRLLHHAYDWALFLALGLLSFAGVRLAGVGLSRWPLGARARVGAMALALFCLTFGLSWFIVKDDVSSFAQRLELELWRVMLVASLLCALASSATLLLRSWLPSSWRWALLPVGLATATSNAFILPSDYPAGHFMLAWLSALVIGYALEGLRPFALRAGTRLYAGAVLTLAVLAALVLSPRSEVLRRLQSLTSSVAAPLLARMLPAPAGPDLAQVMPEVLRSPWLGPREGLPATPPSQGLGLRRPRLLVLFTVDAMRADVLNDPELRKQLPTLSRIADESTYFTHSRSPTPATNTTFATIYSGRYFTMMSWDLLGTRRNVLHDPTPRFSEILASSGVHTVSLPTVARLYATYNVCRGFATEIQVPRRKQGAKAVMDLVLEQLDQMPAGSTFLTTHFMDAHAPYDSAGRSGTPFERYLRELGLVDAQLARFLEELRKRGLEQDTVMVITADHGEAFGEHGETQHLKTVYEELIRVPLLVRLPGQPGRRSSKEVSLIDLGPTILDLFGQSTPPTYLGQSLAPLLVGRDVTLTRPLATDAGRGAQGFYFADGKKVILHRVKKTIEVYDLRTDPGELTNLFERDRAAVDRYVQTARYFFASIRAKDFELDDDERE